MIYINYTGKIDQNGSNQLVALLTAFADRREELTLTIASPGGCTHSGFMLHAHLRAFPGKIITHSIGHVESSAVPVFLAGKERFASPLSSFMIHLPTMRYDASRRLTANELALDAQTLRQQEANLINILANNLTIQEEEIKSLLTCGHRFSAQDAKDVGMVSGITEFAFPPGAQMISITGGS